ncbi:AAA family ATPase, partial [Candidatus Bipolaricaulota bacterium]|nr:AAA family ATPase [Candidatus Bipolaricaulota bacterium]
MTRINRVALTGFKSFRKKTVVPFFDGLTAIIGENGSGKSNLFDAISFVMGRRSSQLRSDRMEHLIFNGGEKYSPAQAAEVTLHLSNTNHIFDHLLANGDSPPEITIGRRVSHGSSSYYFMGKPCSRAMVDQVLVQAKIDPDGQQLIAQGALTKVIKDNAATRRQIIDEICGIAAYDEKRKKAIVELKEVKSKLNTHRIILAERRRRLLSLSRERDAALEYQRMTQELDRLEASIRYLQRKKAEEKLLLSEKECSQFSGRIGALQEDVEKLDLQIENKEWELESVREEMHSDGQIDLIKEVEHLRSEISRKQGEIDLKRQQVTNLHQMIDEVTRIKAAEEARNKTAAKRSGAVQAILERKRSGVYGTIASIATPNSGFEIPFQTAAAGHLNDIVVDSRETAINCINYLKENHLGRVRILPLRRLVTRPKSLAS